MRVLAAMSGGVDSAVAAARALDAGHDVTGVHLALDRAPAATRCGSRGCCSAEDAGDARRVADRLGVPFYVWDLSERFEADVIDDFVAEYAAGRTPNPCLRCNSHIKFAALLDRAVALGFDAVATGHYARLTRDADGDVALRRAADPAKDQSYVLGVLTQERLRRSLFPLGDSTKDEVRAEASERGFAVAAKPDSHDICFIPDGDTAGFLARRLGARPGAIVDEQGAELGRHEGAHAFTVGQRRGLRLGRPAADGRPRHVLRVSVAENVVVVGPRERLAVGSLRGRTPTWTGRPVAGEWPGLAQVRAHGECVPARFAASGGGLSVRLDAPLLGVAPGQTVVAYDGDRVVLSAVIERTEPAAG